MAAVLRLVKTSNKQVRVGRRRPPEVLLRTIQGYIGERFKWSVLFEGLEVRHQESLRKFKPPFVAVQGSEKGPRGEDYIQVLDKFERLVQTDDRVSEWHWTFFEPFK